MQKPKSLFEFRRVNFWYIPQFLFQFQTSELDELERILEYVFSRLVFVCVPLFKTSSFFNVQIVIMYFSNSNENYEMEKHKQIKNKLYQINMSNQYITSNHINQSTYKAFLSFFYSFR